MYKRFIIFSVNQQYQDLDACLQRLGKPGNPHPPSVRLNNLLLVQLGFLIEQKQNNNQDIEKLFHKLFPNNEYHLGSVKSLTTIAHKNFQKLKQNKKKSLEDIQLFLDTDREVDIVYLGPYSQQAGVTKYSVINNVVKPISCKFISNGLIAELLNVKTVSEKTIFNIVNTICNGQFLDCNKEEINYILKFTKRKKSFLAKVEKLKKSGILSQKCQDFLSSKFPVGPPSNLPADGPSSDGVQPSPSPVDAPCSGGVQPSPSPVDAPCSGGVQPYPSPVDAPDSGGILCFARRLADGLRETHRQKDDVIIER